MCNVMHSGGCCYQLLQSNPVDMLQLQSTSTIQLCPGQHDVGKHISVEVKLQSRQGAARQQEMERQEKAEKENKKTCCSECWLRLAAQTGRSLGCTFTAGSYMQVQLCMHDCASQGHEYKPLKKQECKKTAQSRGSSKGNTV